MIPGPLFGKAKKTALLVLAVLVVVCIALSWNSQGSGGNLSFLRQKNRGGLGTKKTLVDLTPWQTAQTLAALAVTAEENEYAHDAERLADHEVDQAFASALREARLRSAHFKLTGEALDLSRKIANLQQLIVQDQALVQSLTPSTTPGGSAKVSAQPTGPEGDDLDVAKAQLGLDSDELADAQHDLDRVAGDDSNQIQEELAQHEASMKEYDSNQQKSAQIAAVSVRVHGTLAGRVSAWFAQNDRYDSIIQAQQQATQDAATLTTEHNALEGQINAASATSSASDRTAKLNDIKDRSAQRQILSITDDRIETQQQIASIYGKWAAQVQLQHKILGRLILQSLSTIFLIVIGMLICDTLVRQLMAHPLLDRRQTQTLRSIIQLAIQLIGVLLILLVVFGTPKETPTILGLATAALTIALQDFILAFLGWFVLVGKNGMHVGDWVEINGVGGEVTEVGLFYTSLLETGNLSDKGHPTGRRITFMNGFAIRGQYFNFSTSGQWMWDEISVNVPDGANMHGIVEKIHQIAVDETQKNTELAESEWKGATHAKGLTRFSAEPVVNLRPSGSGISTQVSYVTRASERFEIRNRLYQRIVDVLQKQGKPDEEPQGVGNA